ncbi:LYR motif-containing protein 2 isoform X3 [Oratosquilla oratoria]|uniref:LYR motif-containing protein 2 isoform X3 n=1 Tax=Oratosquilla oratoria TaxID=337810 RepID=UPI003F7775E2
MKITHIVHMARLPPNAMSLKRFMLRNEVLKLYRSILREIQKLPDKSHQQELQAWARNDFEAQRHCDDEYYNFLTGCHKTVHSDWISSAEEFRADS